MTRVDLEVRLCDCRDELEVMGMEHDDACRFLSEVMNIGFAIEDKVNAEKTKYVA